jgi:hypothetical protein
MARRVRLLELDTCNALDTREALTEYTVSPLRCCNESEKDELTSAWTLEKKG